MNAKSAITTPKSAEPANISELLKQYASGPIQFAGTDNAFYERHLTFDTVVDLKNAGPRERFEAFARSVRDVLSQRWVHTENTYRQQNPKRVYYLSMEFLIGRSLANNVTNLRLDPLAQQAVAQKNLNWLELVEQEPDAGLGNGGLGRLAACFIESMATMQLPAMGYGLRYEYGIFRRLVALYADSNAWARKAIFNLPVPGSFPATAPSPSTRLTSGRQNPAQCRESGDWPFRRRASHRSWRFRPRGATEISPGQAKRSPAFAGL
jgi:Carbohydrate phosphorylase